MTILAQHTDDLRFLSGGKLGKNGCLFYGKKLFILRQLLHFFSG